MLAQRLVLSPQSLHRLGRNACEGNAVELLWASRQPTSVSARLNDRYCKRCAHHVRNLQDRPLIPQRPNLFLSLFIIAIGKIVEQVALLGIGNFDTRARCRTDSELGQECTSGRAQYEGSRDTANARRRKPRMRCEAQRLPIGPSSRDTWPSACEGSRNALRKVRDE